MFIGRFKDFGKLKKVVFRIVSFGWRFESVNFRMRKLHL